MFLSAFILCMCSGACSFQANWFGKGLDKRVFWSGFVVENKSLATHGHCMALPHPILPSNMLQWRQPFRCMIEVFRELCNTIMWNSLPKQQESHNWHSVVEALLALWHWRAHLRHHWLAANLRVSSKRLLEGVTNQMRLSLLLNVLLLKNAGFRLTVTVCYLIK